MTKSAFNTDSIVVCAAVIAMSFALAVIPSPPITLTVAEPPSVIAPPPVNPVPAVTVTASSANLAIGISSLSISATIAAANPSVTPLASNTPLALIFPLAVMLVVTSKPFFILKSFDIASLSTIVYIL